MTDISTSELSPISAAIFPQSSEHTEKENTVVTMVGGFGLGVVPGVERDIVGAAEGVVA